MAKLYFYYSAMNAGKSTLLLQSNHNYHERGMDTLLYTPDFADRDGKGLIASRIGLQAAALCFDQTFNFTDDIGLRLKKNDNISCILIDEAHFLTKAQVKQLTYVVYHYKRPALCYGIRTDFCGELFPGSHYLLAWAQELIEVKTICHCGSKATMVLRLDESGKVIKNGAQILIGGNDRYVSVCQKHHDLGQAFTA